MSDSGKKTRKNDSNSRDSSDQELTSPSVSNSGKTPSIYTLGNDLQDYLERESLGYQMYPGAEHIVYDYNAERLNLYPTNLIESTAHFVKGCLGAGILSMHVGFMYGGLWTSLVATVVISILMCYSMRMLVKSAQKMYIRLRIPRLSYADLAEVAVATGPWRCFRKFSKTFRYIVDSHLFIRMCGTCSVYEIMIAITVKQALETVSPAVKDINLSLRSYILIVTLPLIALCLIRNIKYLAPFSIASDVFIAICVLITIYYSIAKAENINDRPAWRNFHSFLRFTGICLFSLDGVGVTLNVENNMRKPKYFAIVLQYGMPIVMFCVITTGFFGYWGWGDTCVGPITLHMPSSTVHIILQFLIAITLSVTFAVNLWVPFRIAWYYIVRRYRRKRGIWERFYRVVHVSLITSLSVAFPNLIKVMIFLGNFILAFVALIFPAFIESLVTWREHHKGIRWRLLKNIFLMLFGTFLSVGAFYAAMDL